MTKGTPSMGKKNKITHIRCRRCGRHSFNKCSSECAACGFGQSSKMKKNAWKTRDINRDRKRVK